MKIKLLPIVFIFFFQNTYAQKSDFAIGDQPNVSRQGDLVYLNGKPLTGDYYDTYNKKIPNKCNCNEEAKYLNGMRNGITTKYYSTGTKKIETNYSNGNKEGQEIYYHNNGKIKVTYNYSGGKFIIGTYPVYKDNGEFEKNEHYEYKVCNFCNGDGKQSCSACSGKGKFTCQYCSNGKVNCNTCYGKGTVQCNKCYGNGTVTTCQKCNGAGTIQTNVYIGVVTSTCSDCNGTGRGNFICNQCNRKGTIVCNTCSGTGKISCSYCSGWGYKNCKACEGTGKTTANCSSCGGTGKSSEVIMIADNDQNQKTEEKINNGNNQTNSETKNNNEQIYDLIAVSEQPQFPGGNNAMFDYLKLNIEYPATEKQNGIQGKVFVTFIIDKDGSITSIGLYKGIVGGDGCNKEALRVVKEMPKWLPGKQNGNLVKVRYILPIKFQL